MYLSKPREGSIDPPLIVASSRPRFLTDAYVSTRQYSDRLSKNRIK